MCRLQVKKKLAEKGTLNWKKTHREREEGLENSTLKQGGGGRKRASVETESHDMGRQHLMTIRARKRKGGQIQRLHLEGEKSQTRRGKLEKRPAGTMS